MEVINKFSVKNSSHRQIYCKKSKSSINFLQKCNSLINLQQKLHAVDKFTCKKWKSSINILYKMQVIDKFTIKNASCR